MAEACGGWRGRGRWQRGNVVGSQRWKLRAPRKNTRLPAVQARPWAPTAPHEGPSSPHPALTPLAPPCLSFIHNLSALGGRPASPEPLKAALGGSQTTAWLLVPGPLPALESGSNQLCQTARGYSATQRPISGTAGTALSTGLSRTRAICPFSSWPSSPSASSHVWGFYFSSSLSAPP